MSLWVLDPKELWFPYKNEMDGDRVAIGGDLHWVRVLKGFEKGCYLNYAKGEDIQWYSPEQRAVIFPHLQKKSDDWEAPAGWSFQWDQHFEAVMLGCARPHEEKPWLHAEVQSVYLQLHQHGYAHALSVLHNGELVGGLMGVAVGRVFFGMSMYHEESNASKYALEYLIHFLKEKKWKVLDVQKLTPFLSKMGAVEIQRDRFLDLLKEQMKFRTVLGDWSADRSWLQKDPYPLTSEWPKGFNPQDPCPFLV
jgi:leucyl/phenylalanyl-tRNA--protein transferase